jgi:hypothetical protein
LELTSRFNDMRAALREFMRAASESRTVVTAEVGGGGGCEGLRR